jgi:sec-independent protein translocase protein TatA
MFGVGFGELLIVVTVFVLAFSRRLPDLGGSFGAAVKRFKKALNEPDEIDITAADESAKPHDRK